MSLRLFAVDLRAAKLTVAIIAVAARAGAPFSIPTLAALSQPRRLGVHEVQRVAR